MQWVNQKRADSLDTQQYDAKIYLYEDRLIIDKLNPITKYLPKMNSLAMVTQRIVLSLMALYWYIPIELGSRPTNPLLMKSSPGAFSRISSR
jgi:hypothetical protein